MIRTFKSTTALVLSLSLATGPVFAQDTTPECDPETPELPCTIDGAVIETQDALDEAIAESGLLGALGLTSDADADAEVEAEAEPEPGVDAGADAEMDVEADAEAAPAPAEAEPAVEAEEEPAVEAEAEPAPEAESAPAVEAEAEPVMEEDTAVEPEVEPQVEADTASETGAASEAELEEALAAEAEGETNVEETTDPAEMTANGAAEAEETGLLADIAAGDDAQSGEQDMAEEVAPTPEETVEDTPVTAAASGEAEGEAEVTTEELTEEDVRTADQDFDTAVNAEAPTASDDDDGLSNFEKAILLGLGAVAVGSILDNGNEVVSNSGDRIVVQQPDGTFRVLKDDDVLLRQPGSQVQTETFSDGSTRTTVTQTDGSQIITIRANDGRVLRRALVQPDGTQVQLFDDTQVEQEVDVATLSAQKAPAATVEATASEADIRRALSADLAANVNRTFSLRQVRNIREVRELAPVIELDTITFETGSSAIQPDQARELSQLGNAIRGYISERPGAVFLIEGHTDAVGNAGYNLALSDRRAETVALALTEYFDVPPANLVTQGYGESVLKVRTLDAEEENRRAVVRNVTSLLQ